MVERVARYGNDFDVRRGPGLIGRAAAAVARNPVRAVAGLVIVAGTVAIIANATFFQTGEHPSPLFATRDGEPAAVAAAPAPAPAAAQAPAADDLARLVELTMLEPPPVRTAPASPSVVEVQQLLTAQGYEPGVVDGLFGARTRTAIEAYQRAQNLPVTGEVTEALVEHLRETAAGAPTAVAAAPEEPAPAPAAGGQPSETATILAVQTALNQTGFGPIAANGTVSTETADAIRRFQLDQGLTPTGRVDEALVARMTAIGALELR